MAVYLSPETRLKLCKLIADRIREADLKFYATLRRVELKGPAFYAYIEGRSIPSEDVVPKIVSLALALDYDEAMKIIQVDLRDLTEFIDQLVGFASAGVSTVDHILSSILGSRRSVRRPKTRK
ncbi:MAG: hypothetical protein QMC77_07890 [Methanocellales archaeon]|nr:hypothetical protein [Methanocellales archaeon]